MTTFRHSRVALVVLLAVLFLAVGVLGIAPAELRVVALAAEGPCGLNPCSTGPPAEGPCGPNPCSTGPPAEGPCGPNPCSTGPPAEGPCGLNPCPTGPPAEGACGPNPCSTPTTNAASDTSPSQDQEPTRAPGSPPVANSGGNGVSPVTGDSNPGSSENPSIPGVDGGQGDGSSNGGSPEQASLVEIDSEDESRPAWPLITIGGLALALTAAVIIRSRRPRASTPEEQAQS